MSINKTRNRKFWLDFISMYRDLPELWDVKSNCYKNRILKDEAYEILVEKMKEMEPEADRNLVRLRINALRTNYRRELKKINASKRSSGGKVLYSPTLWYFDDLEFLRDQGLQMQDTSIMEMEYEEAEETNGMSQHEYIVPEPRTDLDSDAGHSYSPQPTEQELAPVAPKKRKKTKEATNWTEPKRVDSNSLYGEYVADSIRNLKNRTLQSWVRHQISNVLYTAEQAYFQNPSQCLKVDDMNFTIDTSTLPNLQSGGEEKKTDSEAKEPKGSPGVNEPASTTKEAEIYFKEEPLFFKEPNSPKSPTTLT